MHLRPHPTRRRALARLQPFARARLNPARPALLDDDRHLSEPHPRAIRSTSLTTLAIISLSMIEILARMFSCVNAMYYDPRDLMYRYEHPLYVKPQGITGTYSPYRWYSAGRLLEVGSFLMQSGDESARRTGNYPTCMRNLDGPERGHRSVR